jgi:hypothetical protein
MVTQQPMGSGGGPSAPVTALYRTSLSSIVLSSGCPHLHASTSEYRRSPQFGQRPQQSQWGRSHLEHSASVAARIAPQDRHLPHPGQAAVVAVTMALHGAAYEVRRPHEIL